MCKEFISFQILQHKKIKKKSFKPGTFPESYRKQTKEVWREPC